MSISCNGSLASPAVSDIGGGWCQRYQPSLLRRYQYSFHGRIAGCPRCGEMEPTQKDRIICAIGDWCTAEEVKFVLDFCVTLVLEKRPDQGFVRDRRKI